ncbi:MAG: efflux RND transporter periplasmic adaptor subunit [Planctomycetota bacterium]
MTNSSRNLLDLQPLSKIQNPIPKPPFSWKTRILLPFSLFGITISLFLFVGVETFLPAISVRIAPVIPKQVQGGQTQTALVQAAGWIEPDPYMVHITALADGIVSHIYVLEGQSVQKDQLLVQMIEEDAQLEFRRVEANLLAKKADLEFAQAEEKAAQINWDHLTDRKRATSVAKAQVEETKSMIKKANAEILVEQALLKKTESDYQRTVLLIKENAASQSDLIETEALYLAQKAKWEVATRHVEVLQETLKRLEIESSATEELLRLKNEEQRTLEQAHAKVKLAQSAITSAEVDRDEKMLHLQRMQIRSPMDGMIVKRYVEPGSKVLRMVDDSHSMHLISLYDPKKLQVRVDVPLADVAFIQPEQSAEIIVEVLPDIKFSGKVTRIIHEANIQKNTLEVKVALQEPRSELRPEMLARVKFLAQKNPTKTEESRESLFVRTEALQSSGTSLWVLKNYDGHYGFASKREVRTGNPLPDGWIEILEGVQMGDLIILSPPSNLKEGSRIRVDSEFSS